MLSSLSSHRGAWQAKIIVVIVLIGIVIGFWFAFIKNNSDDLEQIDAVEEIETTTGAPVYEIIGSSVEGRKIESYTYGNGQNLVAFIGGIHGGYEWNSTLLAYELMDYLEANPDFIPENTRVSVIPSANPDGMYKIIGKEGRFSLADAPSVDIDASSGRFNANNVDLNRNFDCKWQPESTWRGNVVDAGTSAFSEPEAVAIRDFVLKNDPSAVVFWHSQANTVYAAECNNGISPVTLDIMNVYAKASGYNTAETFDQYEITGEADGWLANIGIPAITVELKTHQTVEWQQNLLGIKAILEYFDIIF